MKSSAVVNNFAVVRSLDAPGHFSLDEFSTCTRQFAARMNAIGRSMLRRRFFVLLLLASLPWTALQLRSLTAGGAPPAVDGTSIAVDPDKASSELNHHIAGLLLIIIGLMVICGHKYKRLAFVQRLWPLLFVIAGVFLAVWSDREIWPRGDLSWAWLLHDTEARQHKIYAILLIAIGVIEYLRSRARLSQRWAPWVFPLLAIFGGVFLFFHEHGGPEGHPDNSGHELSALQVSAPETQPALQAAQSQAAIPHQHDSSRQHGSPEAGPSAMPASHHAHATGASPQPEHHHEHHMTAAMLNVRREHMWFAVVGFCIAFCKFLYDARPHGKRVTPYLWANSMILLGILLVLYTE